ncbi:hypothetical protein ACSZNH_19535 [Aeromonas dhakensis]|uniref:hypothetical protein n=1 Tax=Aeromonas TaxID=642 RepID=UPI00191F0A17|nr:MULTISPECIES: hypothetical protein [Aeromonas]MBL0527327.1 hypothetical protein [Aeromonas dhakensis]QXA16486.1 hypothetical protein I6L33_04710 [Aeromonas sp. FDAARGOS 1403]WAF72615.1 hypothetical protein NRK99_22205 [Aeromonas dhakensis]
MVKLSSELTKLFRITNDDISIYLENNSGFYGLHESRISSLLLAQLTNAIKNRKFSSFAVTDLMQAIDNVSNRRVLEKRFKHPPLQGLYKAHFITPAFIMRNLINEWGLHFENSKKLEALCNKIVTEDEMNPSKHGWQDRFAYEFVIEGYRHRAQKNNITGEWLIYSKYKGMNIFLCLASHSSTTQDDLLIYEMMMRFCAKEFPFLFKT